FCLLLADFGGLGFVLLVALALVSFIWHFFVNNRYQNWLTRCYYGASDNRFKDLYEQQSVFLRLANDSTRDNTTDNQANAPDDHVAPPGFPGAPVAFGSTL